MNMIGLVAFGIGSFLIGLVFGYWLAGKLLASAIKHSPKGRNYIRQLAVVIDGYDFPGGRKG